MADTVGELTTAQWTMMAGVCCSVMIDEVVNIPTMDPFLSVVSKPVVNSRTARSALSS